MSMRAQLIDCPVLHLWQEDFDSILQPPFHFLPLQIEEKFMSNTDVSREAISKIQPPQDWAAHQINLGSYWAQLSTGDSTVNLKKAIACFEAALTVFTE